MSHMITVTAWETDEIYGFQTWPFDELMQALTAARDAVPAEQRDGLTVEIDLKEEYEVTHARVRLRYQRPETAAETAERKAREARREQEVLAHERRLYEALKAKFKA